MPLLDTASVFQRVLADSYGKLPATLQRIHDARPSKQLRGRCTIERGSGLLVKWFAPVAVLPPAALDIPLTVAIEADVRGETWARNFNGHRMCSRLWAQDEFLAERLGAITLLFDLRAEQGRIEWRVAGVRFLGIPLPSSWFSRARATEQMIDGRYTFDVRATLPLIGLLVHYRGWLAE